MSNSHSNDVHGPDAGAMAEDQGYAPEPVMAAGARRSRADEDLKRRNLRATFGSGPGKLALIAVAVVVVVFGAIGLGSMRKAETAASQSKVDAPASPEHVVTTNAVTAEEAARRAEQSRREAQDVQAQGGSYQPGFDYNVSPKAGEKAPPEQAQFSGFDTPAETARRAAAGAGGLGQDGGVPQNQASASAQADQQRREQDAQRLADKMAAEQKAAEGDRDKYVDQITQEVVKQIGGMFSSQGADSLNSLGSYTQTSYYPAVSRDKEEAAAARAVSAHQRAQARKVAIKAGSTMYAMLDSEVNTDDGRTVLATIRSGAWKGAKLIGMIEQAQNNISLSFTTLAPQDERPTMRVRAVALRESDAKLGMAEKIDHHTFSRYTALAAAALLQGAGRVYQQPIGTTVVTNGGIVTTNQQPSDRQVIGSAVGELGNSIGAEIRRRGFNQPSTYSTPAEKGFILYFLDDVAPNAAEDGPQQPQPQQAQGQGGQAQLTPAMANAPTQMPSMPFPQGGFNPNAAGAGGGAPYGGAPYGYAPGYGYGAAQAGYGYDGRYGAR